MYALSGRFTEAGIRRRASERARQVRKDALLAALVMRVQAEPVEAQDEMTPKRQKRPHPRDIIREISERTGVAVADILGPSRSRPYVEARHDAIVQVYQQCRNVYGGRFSLSRLGLIFGGRDHTSILHVLRKRGLRR